MRTRWLACLLAGAMTSVCEIGLAQTAADAPRADTRNAVGFRMAPLQGGSGKLAVWYPAEGAFAPGTLTVAGCIEAEYAPAAAADAKAGFRTGVARSYGGARGIPSGPRVPELPDSVFREFLEHRTDATLDAPARGGTFPLIVLTIPLGNTGAANQVFLAEHIASHGFVVASGPTPAPMGPNTSYDDYVERLRRAADVVVDAARRQPGVDAARVGAIDPTGCIALRLQLEHPRFQAITAFDEMPFPDRDRAALSAADLDIAILRIPLGDPPPNEGIFEQLRKARVSTASIPGATHGILSPVGAYFARQLDRDTTQYDSAVQHMLEFFEAELRR
jgi:dienelactone hydrolase